MSIETAYATLAERLEQTLRATLFMPDTAVLEIDPESPFEPSGDETDRVSAAALVKVRTYVARQAVGRPAGARRYVVERECRLELALAGPNREARLAVDLETLSALAMLPEQDPTLGGTVERFLMGEMTDEDLPPNGIATFLTFVLRVRSGDPLGMSE
ncbi:hypothetical protein [Brevundimonas subvibrioides]|uniref:Uncharacterized protein n=1 Tax=Brevundimonas subvibrioides (strain ATCC 15264 / DSM 4735 / LMG 14903 / NBRC 16000 / CB 81) TaxID=633149 RepID=D9QFY3_BRESC|nr:hypothetical protein [Brevundimonas subvibrioides]ADL00697.1 hypothetical protein Bresu_1385 [Brevundimonas subvibrioides ATCC 15264]